MTAATGDQVSVATSIQKGADGKHWVALHVNFPLGAFAIAVPPDAAIALADGLPDMLRDAADQARRTNKGLVIAQTIDRPTE